MIYYSIIDPNGQLVATIEEKWLPSITSVMEVRYKEKLKICKIDINRYEKIDSNRIKDKVTNEVIFCTGRDVEQSLNKLNELNRINERHNAKIRAMEMIK